MPGESLNNFPLKHFNGEQLSGEQLSCEQLSYSRMENIHPRGNGIIVVLSGKVQLYSTLCTVKGIFKGSVKGPLCIFCWGNFLKTLPLQAAHTSGQVVYHTASLPQCRLEQGIVPGLSTAQEDGRIGW